MYSFSESSNEKLAQCHFDLRLIANHAIEVYDFSVICGYRGKEKQNEAFKAGASKLKFPASKHNKSPSWAFDIAPYPIKWDDSHANLARYFYLAGVVMSTANFLGINLRWGGDFNLNNKFNDDRFVDLVHFELITSSNL